MREAISARNVEFSTYLWSRAYCALQLVTLREKGPEGVQRLKYNFSNGHGRRHFLAGLDKLGIRNDPPAVAAAKYHYMGNDLIGAVAMEYVHESDRKVWIRYTAPFWSFPGTSLLATPAAIPLAGMQGWHRYNGTWLGCPRLGYVCTKLLQYGDPYNEGYFIEYDHDISIEEAFKFEPVTTSPEFDPDAAPKLDPVLWPEARLLKARRRYAENYAAEPAHVMFDIYGVAYSSFLISQAMLGLATQHGREIAARMGISGNDAKSIATLLLKVLHTLGDDADLECIGDRYEITRSTFAPLHGEQLEEMHSAFFAFFTGLAKVLTAKVALVRTVEQRSGQRVERWCLTDSERRLF